MLVALAGWSALATPGPSDRDAAKQLLAALHDGAPAASAPFPASRAENEARRSLQRADDARRAGDPTDAAHLEGLAREWAELARDTCKAVEIEKQAEELQRKVARQAQAQRRERALLDEMMARRARAEAELKELRKTSSAALAPPAVAAARAGGAGSAKPSGKSAPPQATTSPPRAPAPSAPPPAASGSAAGGGAP